MNDAWTSSNVSRGNKSLVNVRRGGRGENQLCGWQLSFTLYSLKSLPCVRALCFLPSPSLRPSTYVCVCGWLTFLHWSHKWKMIIRVPLFLLLACFCDLGPQSRPSRSHPLHQWREREHPPSGGHVVWADSQLELGGGLQSPDYHPPPHDVRQRGRKPFHSNRPNQPENNKKAFPPRQSVRTVW